MKRCIFLVCFISFLFLNVYSVGDSKDQIYIEHTKGADNHHLFILDDEPIVFYDSRKHAIIIDGNGTVDSYHVEIISMATSRPIISTVVSGSYAAIDVSGLHSDQYILLINTPLDNTYTFVLNFTDKGMNDSSFICSPL